MSFFKEQEARRFCRFVFFNLVACVIAYLLLISHELTNTYDGMWSGAEYRNYAWVVQIGRWFWPLIGKLQMNICPEPVTSILSLTMYVLGGCLVAWWFGLKDSVKGYLLVLAATVNTAVCVTLTYRYTSPTFALSYLLSIVAVWALSRERILSWFVSTACIILALALYQSNIGCACVMALIYLIWLLQNDDGWKKITRFFCMFGTSLLASFVLYKIFWDIALKIFHVNLAPYRGGDVTALKIITEFPKSFLSTYRDFFSYFFENELKHNIYQRLTAFGVLLVLLVLIDVILGGQKLKGKAPVRWLLAALCLLLIPPAANVALILAVDAGESSIQMTTPMATVLPFLLCVANAGDSSGKLIRNTDRLRTAMMMFILFGSLSMVSVDQHVMLKSRENATAMMNRVAIDLGEDMNPEGGFVFAGRISDNPHFLRDQLWERANHYARYGEFIIGTDGAPMSYYGLLRDSGLSFTFNWDHKYWTEMKQREEVKAMPIYPDEGYIQQFGKTIVIRFS